MLQERDKFQKRDCHERSVKVKQQSINPHPGIPVCTSDGQAAHVTVTVSHKINQDYSVLWFGMFLNMHSSTVQPLAWRGRLA